MTPKCEIQWIDSKGKMTPDTNDAVQLVRMRAHISPSAGRISDSNTTENPFDHRSSPDGCHEDCPACAWETAQRRATESVTDRWQREKRETNAALEAFGKLLAQELGDGWKYREPDGDDRSMTLNYAVLDYLAKSIPYTTDGRLRGACCLTVSKKQQGSKLSWHVSPGGIWDGKSNYLGPRGMDISVSRDKNPVQIARDIKRRILDKGYFDAFDKAVAAARDRDDEEGTRKRYARELAAIVGTAPWHYNELEFSEHYSVGYASLKGKVNSTESVHLEFTVTPEEASDMLYLFAARHPKGVKE